MKQIEQPLLNSHNFFKIIFDHSHLFILFASTCKTIVVVVLNVIIYKTQIHQNILPINICTISVSQIAYLNFSTGSVLIHNKLASPVRSPIPIHVGCEPCGYPAT